MRWILRIAAATLAVMVALAFPPDAAPYNFIAQTPGGSLVVGTNVVMMEPCPEGVNGTDIQHKVYISGGTGTPEAALITGGTCTSGAARGTLIIHTDYKHSGAWTVRSATAGIQETAQVLATAGDGGRVLVTGDHEIEGTIHMPAKVWIQGEGWHTTTLRAKSANTPLFYSEHSYFSITDLQLIYAGSGPARSGSFGVLTNSGVDVLYGGEGANDFYLERLNIVGFHVGMKIVRSLESDVNNVKIHNSESHGYWGIAAEGRTNGLVAIANKGHGIYLSTPDGVQPWFQQVQTYGNGGCGVYSLIAISMIDFFLNNDSLCELYIDAHGTADAGYVAHGNIQWAGQNPYNADPSYPIVKTAPAVQVVHGPVTFDDVHIFGPNGEGFLIEAPDITIANSRVVGSGAGGDPTRNYLIKVTGGFARISNNVFTSSSGTSLFAGGHNIVTGNTFNTVSPVNPTVLFPASANDFNTFTGNWVANQQAGGSGPAISVGANVQFATFDPWVYQGTVTSGVSVLGATRTGSLELSNTAFGSLPVKRDGTQIYCVDCARTDPCASGGTGAFAKRLNGAWVCN